MNAEDLARLAVAKRAFHAAQPNAREIQTGVRRARLALERRKPRRSWFSKGLVMVVLAVGGLAYAKPQALNEAVARVLPASMNDHRVRGSSAAARGAARAETTASSTALAPPGARRLEPRAPASSVAVANATPVARVAEPSASAAMARSASGSRGSARHADDPSGVGSSSPLAKRGTSTANSDAGPASPPLTDWGRVGRALAQGDEQRALAALADLSENGDPRTRDKADLGRAQLLMARGSVDEACSLARSLTHRRTGSRIERQAQALLKSCR